jgi:hypothetical protein
VSDVKVTLEAFGEPGRPYSPYPHQRAAHALRLATRFLVLVWHRRAGKTVFAVLELVLAALVFTRPDGRFGYICPLLSQSKSVAWTYLKHFARAIPGTVIREAELAIDFPNGARVRLFGADNPDAFRGLYFDGLVLDEVAQMKPNVWGEILRPALMDRQGWAIFIGTPYGTNLFSELYHRGLKRLEGWGADMKRWNDTNVLQESEIAQARSEMTESQWAQEMECDFAAAVVDALITLDVVQQAQARKLTADSYHYAAKVLGIDPARYGDDRTAMTMRQGLMAFPAVVLSKKSNPQVASHAARIIDTEAPDGIFCDVGGQGAGVVDILVDMGYPVVPVNFGESPTDPRFADRRAEMWWETEKWLHLGCIPESTELATDLTGPRYTWKDRRGKFRLESKDDMRARRVKSPDLGDSLALTFYAPVAPAGMRSQRHRQAKTEYNWQTGKAR